MNAVRRLVNALRRRPNVPRAGVLVGRGPEDLFRDYPADGLTPQRLVSIFREADGGSVAAQMALYEQMEEKDAHLFSVANTRRLAVTGLPWEVVSAAELPGWGAGRLRGADRSLADDAAAYCDDVLRNLPGFEEGLVHLSLANGRNIAVAELIWEPSASGIRLVDFLPVDFSRITFDDRGELRLLTAEAPVDGVALPPSKFVVHVPCAGCGLPARGGLMRATAMAYLGKHFAIKDWLIFAEVFGMPVRIARYHPSATAAEKRELLDMLRQLGADATGIFSKAVEIEIKQTRLPGETNLYENLCLYFDREISKAWLGQTLTVDTVRNRASAGAASVHDRVRRDLRDDDLRKEARTLRRDLLATLTRLEFGPDAPVPHFRRIPDYASSPDQLMAALRLAKDIGLSIPPRWAHAALGIPVSGANGEISDASAKTRA